MLQNKFLFNQSSVSLEIIGLPDYSTNENEDNISIISGSFFIDEIGSIPYIFAYPYGEYNLIAKKVAEENFEASFGQHSGSAHPSLGFHELPRFAMNEAYGSRERLVEAVNTLPFIVSEIYPENPVIKENPPSYGFTLKKEYSQVDQLQCFISGIGEANVTVIGRRVEVRSEKKFYRPRHRVNCTMPGENRRWHWLGTVSYTHLRAHET